MNNEQLFHYDNLIFCPANFSFVFNVVNRGRYPDKTFQVILQDVAKSHVVYLTHMLFESNYYTLTTEQREEWFSIQNPWLHIAVVVTTISLILFILNITYAYLEYTKIKALFSKKAEKYYQRAAVDSEAEQQKLAAKKQKLSRKKYMFIIAYITFRVFYSILFTFTVILALLGLVLQSDVMQLSGIQEFQKRKYNESKTISQEIEKHGQDELLRQAELVTNMQGACNNYIEELFDSMLFQVDNITLNSRHHQMFSQSTSISSLLQHWFQEKVSRYLMKVEKFGQEYQANYSRNLDPAFNNYKKYLTQIYENQWLQFPQLLFNRSHYAAKRDGVFRNGTVSGLSYDFGAFLPIEEVEVVQLLGLKWWER